MVANIRQTNRGVVENEILPGTRTSRADGAAKRKLPCTHMMIRMRTKKNSVVPKTPAGYRPSSSRCSTLILSNSDDHFQLSNSHQKNRKSFLGTGVCERWFFEEGGRGRREAGRTREGAT